MSTLAANAKAIFLQAIEKDAKVWTAFLDQACGDDEKLRQRVEGLLQAHIEKDSMFDGPDPTAAHEPLIQVGQMIGPYKIREQIGDGGMGVVYVAEQEKPLRRRVALKVIKPGMDSKAVLARFDAERNALALMNHPNIAKVLDAGTTEQGRPYFVMELVNGVAITEYCDEHKLSIRERLELFTQVCQAVQHAHQKGIIHRDLKPSNVLVTEQDGKALPKVIDFGVAKAIGQSLTDRTIYTSFQSVIGTPLYMSPEQAALSNVDVDTRSDVYSLGVLLYELLTGSTPIEKETLKNAAQDEVLRIIREQDPPKPSTKISSLGRTVAQVSTTRASDPAQLGRLVRGDLDWIVMKALEKERARRYDSASRLAGELTRYLNDEPIEARPPAISYQLTKFCRRHKTTVIAAGIALSALLIGLIATSWGFFEAIRARIAVSQEKYKVERTLQDKEELIGRLQAELENKAIEFAMNLDRDAMHVAIQEAQESGSSTGWAKMVEAIEALFSGDAETAATLIAAARNLGENTLSVDALDAWIEFSRGNAASWLSDSILLSTADPTNAQDRLLCALALAPLEPSRPMEWAQQAFGETRSPVALLVLSQARAYAAGKSGGLDDAQQAIDEAHASLLLLPESPYALHANLLCNHLGLKLAQEANDVSAARLCAEKARKFVDALERYPNYGLGHFHAALFLEEQGNLEDARRRYEILAEINGDYGKCNLAIFLYRQNDIDNALALAETISDDSYLAGIKASLLAEFPERRNEARSLILLERDRRPTDPFLVTRSLGSLCAIGFVEDAKEQAKAVLESDSGDSLDRFTRSTMLFFAGETGSRELLDIAGDSRVRKCQSHLAIAQKALGEWKRELAVKHLRQCFGSPWFADYQAAQTLLNRLDDPQWPLWLDQGKRVEGSR